MSPPRPSWKLSENFTATSIIPTLALWLHHDELKNVTLFQIYVSAFLPKNNDAKKGNQAEKFTVFISSASARCRVKLFSFVLFFFFGF
jgi:hypothetical protein